MIYYCGVDALPHLVEYCQAEKLSRFMLIADDNTYDILGWQVVTALKDQGWDVRTVVLNGSVVADERYLVEVLLHAGSKERAYLAVGSGTLTDIARFTSQRSRNRFISLPTAPSVDGYTSENAPLVIRGFKRSYRAQAPEAVFADLKTLCEAPPSMIAAGFGDMLGKYTALADWKLGHLLWGEEFRPDLEARVRKALAGCVECLPEIRRASKEGISCLMLGLAESGECITEFGDSRPAAGFEHLLSHFWEMKLLREGRPAVLHGAKVGVAAVLEAGLYERLRALGKEEALLMLETSALPGYEAQLDQIERVYGPIAGEIIGDQHSFLDISPERFKQLKADIRQRWDEVQAVAATVPSAGQLSKWLHAAGGPATAEALGISPTEVDLGMSAAHFLRARFNVWKLGQVLGMW
jgi:glycerol-1-phosphate dehydrogenase [NAD(P)+]